MKTKRDFISEITTNEANFKYCAEKGVINGVLLVDIETAMQKYTDQQLILHDVSQQRELLLKEQSDWLMTKTNLEVDKIVDFANHFE